MSNAPATKSPYGTANLRIAQVIAVYPQRRTVEVVYLDNGWREADVPVLGHYVTTDTGVWSQHNVPRPPSEAAAGGINPDPDTRTTLALVAQVAGRSVIMGFMPEIMTQMVFTPDQQDRDIARHPSGTLSTTAPGGSYELQHTGGAYLRVATDADGAADQHQDLTPFGANLNWALPQNDQPTLALCSPTFKLTVRPPNGDTTLESGGFLTVQYVGDGTVELGGNLKVLVNGSVYVSAGADISIQTPTNVTVTAGGNATVQAVGNASLAAGGDVTVSAVGSASVDAGGDASLAAAGSATVAAVGSVTVAAGGDATVGAVGALNLGAGGAITMAAATITADTALFTVTGDIVEGGNALLGLTGAAGASYGAAGASEGAAAAGTAASAAAQAPPVAEQAEADAQQAVSDTNAAAQRAQQASQAAVGTVARLQP